MERSRSDFLISLVGKPNLFYCHSNNSGAIDVMVNPSVLDKKSLFKMLGLDFSSELDIGSHINSVGKLGALLCSIKFLFSGVAFISQNLLTDPV